MLPRAPQAPATHCFSLPGVTRMSAGFPFAPRVSLRGLACHEERSPVPREEGGGRLRHGGTHSPRPCPRPPQRPKAQRPTAVPLGRDRSWKPSRLHYER